MPSPALPLDLLHIIASDLAAHFPRGPPSTVIATFSLSKRLLPVINASLLSGIFHLQFDTRAIHARIPNVTATALAHELKRRWRCLKRIRWAARAGPAVWGNSYSEADIIEDMWTSYLLILENDGKNWDQLVGWAMLPAYVQAYVQWDLYPAAASDDLPQETEFRSLGLWLLWFLSDNQNSLREIDRHPKLKRLLSPIVFSSYAEYIYVDSPRRRDKTEIYVPGSIAPRRLTSHRPLPPGPPLGAHLPRVVRLERVRGGLLATTDQAAVLYEDVKEPAETFRPESLSDELPIGGDPSCVEIIVTGQAIEPNGGMAVGVMRAGAIASGTIRRSDGLITLFARSDNGGGRWLYIGRLSADGSFNGRCRALQDDSTSIVWESVFHMRRRA
ncbi:hypothetical protein FRB99_008561 [Tulasnella sp. 403]|nr:hypothetical protein FRB99_008561 [Tulasnella sp. 403]